MTFFSRHEKSAERVRAPAASHRVLALLAAFSAGVFLALMAFYVPMFAARFSYPLDLEWMESGVLLHVERMLDGQPIYVAPSADFIPFAYPPLFYHAAALVSLFTGVSFQAARAVSILAALVFPIVFFAAAHPRRRRGTLVYSLWAALAGTSLILLEYFTTGSWIDLARPDTLALVLALSGGLVLVKTRTWSGAMLAAGLFSAAFWTKQTMVIPLAAAGLWQAVLDWRRAAVFAAAIAILCGGIMLIAIRATDGWAWFYLREIHQRHAFDVQHAFSHTPRLLAMRLWPAVLAGLAGLAASRRISAEAAFWWLLALSGFLAACIGSGTQWAHTNALLPAVVFLPPAAIASWNGFLEDPEHRTTTQSLLPATAMVLVLFHVHTRHPAAREFRNATPTPRDVAAAHAHVRELRASSAPILIPYHPWNARLAGSPGHFHQHALSDIRAAGLPVPPDILDGFRSQRWKTVVHDRIGPAYQRQWPGLEAFYRLDGPLRVRTVRTFSGNPCGPRFSWSPKEP